mgnify:CR=1 FL=1
MTSYHNIETLLSAKFGFNPESIGRKNIQDAIKSRMDKHILSDEDTYMKMLTSNPEEIERLIEQIVVTETWFFRDRESFRFLKRHIEKLKDFLYQGRMLRVLSVPCSTGEEPYSVAMLLLDAGLSPEQFCIDAVDISRRSIEIAKKAVYAKRSFRGECDDYRPRYFINTDEGYKLDNCVARLVHYYVDNFVQPQALYGHKPYHILFCKNLLIYLNDNARKQVFANIDRLLTDDGVVFTGHSEVMSFLENGYEPVKHARAFACKRIDSKEKAQPKMSTRPLSIKRSFTWQTYTDNTLPSQSNMKAKSIDAERSYNHQTEDVLMQIRELADRGNLNEALNLCERFLKENSDNQEAYYLMGLIKFAMDAFDEAESFFQKALYLAPHHYETLLHMVLLYEKKGDKKMASVMEDRIKRAGGKI